MSDRSEYVRAKCPLFVRADGCRISCKPITYGSSGASLLFSTAEARREYGADFCDDDRCWVGCPIYREHMYAFGGEEL